MPDTEDALLPSSTLAVAEPDGGVESLVEASEAPRDGALSAFQSREFLLFWVSLSLSLTGVWLRITAQGWLVYNLTSNAFLLGLVSFFQAAPVLIASPIAGALLDRVDRRKVLLVVQVIVSIATFLLATLVATGHVQVWHIMVIAVVVGTCSGFDWPARLSLVPALVKPSQLQSAVALNSAAFNGSRVIGPIAAGFLIAAIGAAACFYLNAMMYLPFIVVLATLTIDRASASKARTSSPMEDLVEGYRYIWRTPTIRSLLSVDVVPLTFGIAYFTLAPAVARSVLGLDSEGLGGLLAANGVGYLGGTVLVALLSGIRGRGRIVVYGVAVYAVLIVAFALSTNAMVSGGLLFLIGLTVATYGVMNDTLLQTKVDDDYRGRVLAVYSMFWGLTPIGSLEAGILANVIGVQHALAVNGLIVLLYAPFLWFKTPLRQID